MDYDVEREKQKGEEIRKAFREIFPLASEHDLPWAVCHIKSFLRDRIAREVQEGTHHLVSRVVRVLCEISPPKTHVEDMARIVVEEAKRARTNAVDAYRKAKDFYRGRHSGGCKKLSAGEDCDCFLCACDAEIEAIGKR